LSVEQKFVIRIKRKLSNESDVKRKGEAREGGKALLQRRYLQEGEARAGAGGASS